MRSIWVWLRMRKMGNGKSWNIIPSKWSSVGRFHAPWWQWPNVGLFTYRLENSFGQERSLEIAAGAFESSTSIPEMRFDVADFNFIMRELQIWQWKWKIINNAMGNLQIGKLFGANDGDVGSIRTGAGQKLDIFVLMIFSDQLDYTIIAVSVT